MQIPNNSNLVCMLGSGAWGTAVAMLLAENGYTVNLWCHEPEVAASIAATGYNQRYLPGVKLHKNIIPTHSLVDAMCGTRYVFEAIPVKYLRSVLMQVTNCFTPNQVWVILSKGIEQDTLLLPTQIIDDVFKIPTHKVVFSGPSFAHDLVKKQITAVTIAADSGEVAYALQKMLATDYFRPYAALDPIGAQVGGALKNVIAIGVGMLDGAGYTDNAKAFFLTRGLDEMAQLTIFFGGCAQTLQGLSGVGDLVLTAMGGLSRNLAIGKRIAQGEKLPVIAETENLPEGVGTCMAVHALIQQHALTMPVCAGVYDVLCNKKTVHQMVEYLMARPLENESGA